MAVSERSVLERFIGELQAVRTRIAAESLTNPDDKTAFGFGRAVGRLEGLVLAEQTLEKVLADQEADDSESRRHRGKT